ncbi:unnamed protein product [Calypogeia fissa]
MQLIIVLVLLSLGIGRSWSQSLGTVYSTAQDYSIEHQRGDIEGLYCDLPDNHNPYACESDYWVAYSQSLSPPMSMALCGMCLQITNNDGGASITACILDQKVGEGFDLDLPGFAALDTDGQGAFNGHMFCTAEFVNC